MIKLEHNVATGEVIEIEMTANEIAQWEADKAQSETEAAAKAESVAARQALLDKLGITADEAKLLLS